MDKTDNRNGKIAFLIFSITTLILLVADMTLTYIGTPDLSREANPLVHTFGLGWGALITGNIISFLVIELLYYYTFVKFKRSIIECSGKRQFLSIIFFDRPDKFVWLLYKFPKNKKRGWSYILACTGFAFAIVMTVIRLVVVVEWIAVITQSKWINSYFDFFKKVNFTTPIGRLDILLFATIVVILAIYYWICREYKINQKAYENKGESV